MINKSLLKKVDETYKTLPQGDIFQKYDSHGQYGNLDQREMESLMKDYHLVPNSSSQPDVVWGQKP